MGIPLLEFEDGVHLLPEEDRVRRYVDHNPIPTRPFLTDLDERLYSLLQYEEHRKAWQSEFKLEDDDDDDEEEEPYTLFNDTQLQEARLDAFLFTIHGYHTGKTDLTGRHHDRYRYLMTRLRALHAEYLEVLRLGIAGNHLKAHELWINCKGKWLIPWKLNVTAERLKPVLMCLKQPVKFQELCLAHLPEEILLMVFENIHTRNDAIYLATTSRLFRRIGTPYIYKRLEITSRVPAVLPSDRLQLVLASVKSLGYMALHVEHIQRTPAIHDRLEHLTINYRWHPVLCIRIQDDSHTVLDARMHFSSFGLRVLESTPNLVTLVLRDLELGNLFLTSLRYLYHLRNLELHGCLYSSAEDEVGVDIGTFFRCGFEPIRSHLLISVANHPRSQMLLTLVPRFRQVHALTLRVIHSPAQVPQLQVSLTVDISAPDELDISGFTFFRDIYAMVADSPSRLLFLTHLRIAFVTPVEAWEVDLLVEILQFADLIHLALHGLKELNPDLLSRIARTLPNMRELVLCRVERLRAEEPPLVYAPHLGEFQRLEFFGWNHVPPSTDDISPWALNNMIEFGDEEDTYLLPYPSVQEEEEASVTDLDILGGVEGGTSFMWTVFKAYCPSLKGVALYRDVGEIVGEWGEPVYDPEVRLWHPPHKV